MEMEHPGNGNDGDAEVKAPVQLLLKFLQVLKNKDYTLAVKYCRMILVFEPENPEASEFLPLIQRKLREEQGTEQSSDEGEGSDERSSCSSSSCSSSSSSSPSDDEDEEKCVNAQQPGPPKDQ